jgi:electron transfer flavoprotein beta subunit
LKVAVCVKAVPDAATGRRLDGTTLRIDRSESALSDYDLQPLEVALRLREAGDAEEVVAVSIGPPQAAEAVRKALAMGADRAVLVTDDSLAGADLLVTSRVLAGALRAEEAGLVLFGQQSADGEGACLAAAVAERLGLPVVTQVAELDLSGEAVAARRQTEHGYETIRAPLPAVVAVSDAIAEPRYPSLKGIMGAKNKPQAVLAAAAVGVAGTSGTVVLALGHPPDRGERRLHEDQATAAEAIVDFLAERRLL